MYYIGNLEFAKLTPGEAHFYDLNGDEIEKQTTEIKWDAEAAEKGGFEHFMMKEIHEQDVYKRQSVGGTDLFIKDKYNGFLVRNNDLNTLETTLLSIIDLSREQIEEIKNNALTTANELFTPDKYIEQFNAFLNKCK